MSEEVSPSKMERFADFEEYIRQGELGPSERASNWRTAIGLQQVDGLTPSDYLLEAARRHIEGDITIGEVKQLIDGYYHTAAARSQENAAETEEADKVSSRIAEILSEHSFTFSRMEYVGIHRRLFEGIYKHAGQIRNYDITKREWVLGGDTVMYGAAWNLSETLDHDIAMERAFDYSGLTLEESVMHLCRFTSNLWQIHAFGEGNTRTTAVFLIKYLRSFGFEVNNVPFSEHSWYFRNALVRANYTNLTKNIAADPAFLEAFFRNILLGEDNELKNRYMHVDYKGKVPLKCKNCTLDCTLEEAALLQAIKRSPTATQKELAQVIGKSERTVKTLTVSMQAKGLIARQGGRRQGRWVVVINNTATE